MYSQYTENPKSPTYIASQGPLQNCAGDFWQMVWEQGVSEIIMLSLNDEVDCNQYWGSDGSGVYYHYQLHLVSEHANHPDYPDYIVRSFYLKNLQVNGRPPPPPGRAGLQVYIFYLLILRFKILDIRLYIIIYIVHNI